MDPWGELDRLVMEPFGPFKEFHIRVRNLVALAMSDAVLSNELTAAIEEFHSQLEFMTVRIFRCISVEMALGQDSCAKALRILETHSGRSAH